MSTALRPRRITRANRAARAVGSLLMSAAMVGGRSGPGVSGGLLLGVVRFVLALRLAWEVCSIGSATCSMSGMIRFFRGCPSAKAVAAVAAVATIRAVTISSRIRVEGTIIVKTLGVPLRAGNRRNLTPF